MATGLLLDTHAALWWATDPSELDAATHSSIDDLDVAVWFSAASAWELAIEVRTGRLTVDVRRLVDRLATNGIGVLGIGVDDAIAAGALDWDHRDPFDRMLAAQAVRHDLRLATRDAHLTAFLGDRVVPA
jgi:PIN domain nuclease of toxin-antitoxin system